LSSADTCAWALVFLSEHVCTRVDVVSALQGRVKVLLALSTWQWGCELPWLVVHAQHGVLVPLGDTGCDWPSTAARQHHTEHTDSSLL